MQVHDTRKESSLTPQQSLIISKSDKYHSLCHRRTPYTDNLLQCGWPPFLPFLLKAPGNFRNVWQILFKKIEHMRSLLGLLTVYPQCGISARAEKVQALRQTTVQTLIFHFYWLTI